MSIFMNGYERNLANQFQRNMSRRESEDAVMEIREILYGDAYEQIHPNHVVCDDGSITEEFPPVKALLWAYYNDNFKISALKNFIEGR